MFTFSGILKTLRVQGLWPFCSKFYCRNLALCLMPSSCVANIHWLDVSAFHLNPAFPVLFIHILVYCRFSAIYTFMLVCLMLAVFSCIILYWRAESPCTYIISFVKCFVYGRVLPLPPPLTIGENEELKLRRWQCYLKLSGWRLTPCVIPEDGQGARAGCGAGLWQRSRFQDLVKGGFAQNRGK